MKESLFIRHDIPGWLMVLASSVLAISCAEGEEGGVVLKKDLVFASVGEKELKLDLYLPENSENPPLVVWIHGGGWRGGNKERCFLNWLPEHGYAVASISYRLTDEAIFPAQIHDCKAAVRWLRAHAGDLGYSADRIAVSGSSAGGHLAMLLGMTGGVDELEGRVGDFPDVSSKVDAVIDYYGASDFILRSRTQPHRANKEGSVVYLLLGGGADEKVDAAKLASPAWHVSGDDPPLLIFHGEKDKTVLPDQAKRIEEAYREAGLPVSMHLLEGAAHGGDEFWEGDNRSILLSFLQRHLPVEESGTGENDAAEKGAEKGAGEMAAWKGGVLISPVSKVEGRHTVHPGFNTCSKSKDGRKELFFASTHPSGFVGDLILQDRDIGSETVIARGIEVEDIHRAACRQWLVAEKTR